MPRLKIRHETTYAYERPVSFDTHRLLVRPRGLLGRRGMMES